MLKKILIVLMVLFFHHCDKKEYTDFLIDPNQSCEITDQLGNCCNADELDCNNICDGNSIVDSCGNCNGNDTSCYQQHECNDTNSINYTEESSDSFNCIENNDDYLPDLSIWKWKWGDEFNTQTLDLSKWEYQIGDGSLYGLDNWGNNEEQYYTSDNISLNSCTNLNENCLIITARQETHATINQEYTSGRIRSINSGNFKYGRIDIRAKLPSAVGTWSAFWMLPTNPIDYWPTSGEIDIMEYVAGCNQNDIYTSIHCASNYADNSINETTSPSTLTDFNIDEFNIYSIDWDEESIKWLINNEEVFKYDSSPDTNQWPFDNFFHIILNLAIGGDFVTANCNVNDWGYDAFFIGEKLEIDFIRVFEKISE